MPDAAAPHADTLVFLLSQVGAQCARLFAEHLAPLGLTPRAYGVLSHLGQADRQTQQQLADHLGVHRNNMVAIIDELEAAGWVRRHGSERDRRAFEIHLTSEGATVCREAVRQVLLLEQQVTTALSAAEARTSIAHLQRLADALGLTSGVHPSLRSAGPRSPRPA